MFISGINKDSIAGVLAANHKHIVCVRSDNNAMDIEVVIEIVQGAKGSGHVFSLTQFRSQMTWRREFVTHQT